ncbi:MAG TPA: bifunctional 3-demethylubiquinol 3-O-methyltransferase/2-polyprenyl-6-hydroxyphenol methylase [Gammaproteobacteria bacterium]|jgi:2-polyprenyl-6-hydroxyphenyl methylase/3-demethylubiquinone-9 3-methyltransferase|nr:bifunctional 3-demethylubiquinol 3-O-methyltransferase/2-polyprenyl-6-hydroxyphenol methylase [Gammaproteobacteria bacterium]|tara:strand:- start:67 stop:774 length:708 start_codon:yes stop_codon:yes gene_type:complete
MQPEANVDAPEIEKFDALAHRWWDPNGDFKPLHDINPARLDYIRQRTDLNAGPTVDIGCGGGILSESMASAGSATLGIDMASKALGVAKLHALEAGVDIEYLESTAEQLVQDRAGEFRTVTCMEMLEHVTAYADTVKACAELAQPGGDLFFSTINRNPKSYVMLILGAEYVLNILPRGTHEYSKFIKPSELAQALRDAGLDVLDISGLHYNPLTRSCRLDNDTSTNYIVHARKPA